MKQKMILLLVAVVSCILLTSCSTPKYTPPTKEEIRANIIKHRYCGKIGRERYMILLLEEINEKMNKLIEK